MEEGKRKVGRPLSIPDPETMWQHFVNYRHIAKNMPFEVHDFVGKDATEVYIKKERALTYEGFCNYLEDNGIISSPEHYFMNLDGRYLQFVSVCSRIKRIIRQDQIEGGLAGIYNPSITQRLNNITEKVESTNKHEVTGVQMVFQQSAGCEPLKTDEDEAAGS